MKFTLSVFTCALMYWLSSYAVTSYRLDAEWAMLVGWGFGAFWAISDGYIYGVRA